jgi:hypothetical protein
MTCQFYYLSGLIFGVLFILVLAVAISGHLYLTRRSARPAIRPNVRRMAP